MGRRVWTAAALAACALAGGCSADVQQLRSENRALAGQVQEQREAGARLAAELEACRAHAEVLSSEKGFRDDSLMRVRDLARAHIAGARAGLDELARTEELLDYVGGELIARTKFEDSAKRTVLLAAPLAGDLTIYKVKALPARATTFRLGVFRKTEEGLLCVAATEPFTMEAEAGVVTRELAVPLAAAAGDYLGFTFPERVGIQFDEKTGAFALYEQAAALGELIRKGPAATALSYSLGVFGVLGQKAP